MNIRHWLQLVSVCLLVGGPPAVAQDLAALLEEAERAAPVPAPAPPAGDPAPPASPISKRHPRPAAAEVATATSRVKAVFRDRYSGSLRAADKAALAGEILELLKSTSNKADRWALQSEALRLACEGGDVDLAIDAAKTLSGEFEVEAAELMLDVVKQLSSSAPPAAAARLASECAAVVRTAVDRGQFETATSAIVLAKGLARKGKDPDLIAQINRLSIMVKDREKMDKRLATVLADLKAAPTDTALNAEAGLLLCLLQGRWAEGLPLLMRGGNPTLARLAQLELNGAKTLREQIALGDAWWGVAEGQKSPLQEAAQQRAIGFYNDALNGSEGLERAMLEKRIASVSAASGGSGQTVFLADLKEAEVRDALDAQFFSKDGTLYGKPFTVKGKQFAKAIMALPKANVPSVVVYRVPAGAVRIRGHVGIFTPTYAKPDDQPASPVAFEIVADGKVVWSSPGLKKRDDTAVFDVAIRNASRLELRTTATGHNTNAWGAWLDPVIVK